MKSYFQIKALKQMNNRQKAILRQLNRLMKGSTESKIKHSTIEKHDLKQVLRHEEVVPFIKNLKNAPAVIKEEETTQPQQEQEVRKTIKIKTKAVPQITKQKITEFIKSHYGEGNTRDTYLRAYNNNIHKTEETHVPEFDTKKLMNPEFFNTLKSNKKARHIFSPISVFIRENKYEEKYPAMQRLRIKIQEALHELKDVDVMKAQHKNTDETPKIKLEELKDIFDETYNKIFETKDEEYSTFNLAFLTGFYTLNGFRDDLGNILLNPDTEPEKHNYIKNGKFHLKTYKTDKKFGELIYPIGILLQNVIEKSLHVFPRKFLFINKDNEEQTTMNRRLDKTFTRLLKKPLNKIITINDVRKAWTTEVFETTPEKQAEVAKKMGHSLQTALLYYKKKM